MWISSPVKGFQVVWILFKDFIAVFDGLWILTELNLRLSSVKSQYLQNFLQVFSFLIFDETNSFGVMTSSWVEVSFFESVISFVLSFFSFSQFLFVTHFPFFFNFILEIEKFDFKVEGWIWRDFGWRSSFSVSEIRGADESGFLAFFHGGKSLVPSLDDSSLSEVEFEGTFGICAGIKLVSVFEGTSVEGEYLLSFGGKITRTLSVDDFPKLSWNDFNFVVSGRLLWSWCFSGGVLHYWVKLWK